MMQPDQNTILSNQSDQIASQISSIQTQMNFIQIEFIILIGLGFIFIICLLIAAAWSVQVVSNRMKERDAEVAKLVQLLPKLLGRPHVEAP